MSNTDNESSSNKNKDTSNNSLTKETQKIDKSSMSFKEKLKFAQMNAQSGINYSSNNKAKIENQKPINKNQENANKQDEPIKTQLTTKEESKETKQATMNFKEKFILAQRNVQSEIDDTKKNEIIISSKTSSSNKNNAQNDTCNKETNQNNDLKDKNEVNKNDNIKIENESINKEKVLIDPISNITSKVVIIKNDKNDSGYISQSKNADQNLIPKGVLSFKEKLRIFQGVSQPISNNEINNKKMIETPKTKNDKTSDEEKNKNDKTTKEEKITNDINEAVDIKIDKKPIEEITKNEKMKNEKNEAIETKIDKKLNEEKTKMKLEEVKTENDRTAEEVKTKNDEIIETKNKTPSEVKTKTNKTTEEIKTKNDKNEIIENKIDEKQKEEKTKNKIIEGQKDKYVNKIQNDSKYISQSQKRDQKEIPKGVLSFKEKLRIFQGVSQPKSNNETNDKKMIETPKNKNDKTREEKTTNDKSESIDKIPEEKKTKNDKNKVNENKTNEKQKEEKTINKIIEEQKDKNLDSDIIKNDSEYISQSQKYDQNEMHQGALNFKEKLRIAKGISQSINDAKQQHKENISSAQPKKEGSKNYNTNGTDFKEKLSIAQKIQKFKPQNSSENLGSESNATINKQSSSDEKSKESLFSSNQLKNDQNNLKSTKEGICKECKSEISFKDKLKIAEKISPINNSTKEESATKNINKSNDIPDDSSSNAIKYEYDKVKTSENISLNELKNKQLSSKEKQKESTTVSNKQSSKEKQKESTTMPIKQSPKEKQKESTTMQNKQSSEGKQKESTTVSNKQSLSKEKQKESTKKESVTKKSSKSDESSSNDIILTSKNDEEAIDFSKFDYNSIIKKLYIIVIKNDKIQSKLKEIETFILECTTFIDYKYCIVLKNSLKSFLKSTIFDIIKNICPQNMIIPIYHKLIQQYQKELDEMALSIDNIYYKKYQKIRKDEEMDENQMKENSTLYVMSEKESFKEITIQISCDSALDSEIPQDF